jgi:IS4 transposase
MARRQYIGIRGRLQQFVPAPIIDRLARESGFVRRGRKVTAKEFLWALVLGFATGEERTLAGLHRAYLRVARQAVTRSSFYDRFTPSLVKFLRGVLEHVILRVQEEASRRQSDLLGRLREVLLVDSTVIRLHAWLEKKYPGCRTNHSPAAAKVCLAMGVQGKGPNTVKVKPERVGDRQLLGVGPWVRGRLLVLDLGFYSYALFANIDRYQGYFLSRLKRNANPEIVRVLSRHRGRTIPLEGKRLGDVRQRLKREVLDAVVEVRFLRRRYRGSRHRDRKCFRMVGVLDQEEGVYHFYLTNLPAEQWNAEEIARLYSLRWEIELVFRELKSCYRMDQLPSGRQEVVEALIYASLLTLFTSRHIRSAVRQYLDATDRLPHERWARIFNAAAIDILVIILDEPGHAREVARRIEPFLLREAVDPNRRRYLLLERATGRAA